MKKNTASSGKVWLMDGFIHYESQDYGACKVQVSTIKLVGEYTTDNGPGIDDWFLVLMTANDGWFEISMYAEGMQAMRNQVGQLLGADLDQDLAHSTDFASRIMWPSALKDQPMFSFTEEKRTGWERILHFGANQMLTSLSAQVLEYFASLPTKAETQTGGTHG